MGDAKETWEKRGGAFYLPAGERLQTILKTIEQKETNAALQALVLPGERVDELYWRGLKLIQQPQYFCMAVDAILLADFAQPRPGDEVCDLGAGNGALPLLLWAKEPRAHYTGLELMPKVAALARRNVVYNGLTGHIDIQEGDLKTADQQLGKGRFGLVVSNPPYAKRESGKISATPEVAAARTELHCTLADVVREAAALLRSHGRFALVHRPDRLAEAIHLMSQFGLIPKRLRLVQPQTDKPPILFLLEGIRDGKEGLHVLPTLILRQNGAESPELAAIYARPSQAQKEEETDG